MLETFFDGKRLKLDLNPDEAVAAGASVQAALLKEKSVELEKYLITEVTPLSLGIKTKSNYMTVYIPKNSSLPTIARRNVITATNDQTEMDIEIYEGERKNTTYNNKLGKFNISGLPPNRAGHIEVNISFELDEDGLLTVQAFEKSTEVSNKLTVTMGQFRLSETAIQRALEDAERNRREDDTFEKFNRARCNYDQRCSQILYDINKISSDDERNFVQKKLQRFSGVL
ncbi:hypothetical protein NQ314_017388 [Rhamnusium bicolor]|uniref:Uncharacterized protein n=1 Tax=Rhamnusium bicolor TaxID=1586634 RepID=A0AAV8WTG1_9CUCU|nr:hypothetical protein NQ314_017388 [Rhamnusium bicolor]